MVSLSEQQVETREPPAARPRAAGRRQLFNNYLLWMGFVTVLLCSGATALNFVIDPLWFADGNRITGRNFSFNERIAKMNLLLQDPGAYDCIIFGSSRVTLFDEQEIRDHRCFNLSFSAGNIVEFIAFARYLAELGIRPELVIVGVDGFNFHTLMNRSHNVPEFIERGEPPPSRLRSYFSLTALNFSQRTLRGDAPQPRYYDEEFVGRVLEDAPPFEPPETPEGIDYDDVIDPRRAELYGELREVFPDARFWGYVPPISAWDVAEIRHLNGFLDGYLEGVVNTAPYFEIFYDFSVPSEVTTRRDNTYDGSHYFTAVNAVIAERLQAAAAAPPADGFGLPVHAMSRDDYATAFKTALNRFLDQEAPEVARAEIDR